MSRDTTFEVGRLFVDDLAGKCGKWRRLLNVHRHFGLDDSMIRSGNGLPEDGLDGVFTLYE